MSFGGEQGCRIKVRVRSNLDGGLGTLIGEDVEGGKEFEGVKGARGLLVKKWKISRKGAKAQR